MASPYGYCPTCKGKGVRREKRPNGNDTCINGHVYASRNNLKSLPQDDKKTMHVLKRITSVRDNLNSVLASMSHNNGVDPGKHLSDAWAELNDLYKEYDEGEIIIVAGML